MFRQLKTPPGHVKERLYPKQVNREGDAQRYGELKAIKKDETIFAAYDKAEMRKIKIIIVANSEFVHTFMSLFWTDVIMLAAVDLDLLQFVSIAIGVQRQTEMNIPHSETYRRPSGARYLVRSTLAPMCKSR